MRTIILAGIFALSASTSLAQTDTAPAQAAPEPETTAPAQAAPEPEATAPTDPATASAGGPANLCQELLAFMKAPPPEDAAAAAKPAAEPAKPGEQQAAPAQQEAAGQEEAPAGEDASALAGTTQSGEGATAKPEEGTNSAQEVTGQDGVATDAPEEPGDEKVAAGSVANAPQKESRAAPLPPADVASTPKETVMTVEAAEQLATANDIAACQDMARQMRVAGVAMPPPLIALAALDLQYQQTGGASQQAPETQEPAPQAQEPAPETQEPAAQPEQ